MVASSRANLFASASAGVCALWGPLHGGANQAVLEMLEEIHQDGDDGTKFLNEVKDKTGNRRLMGFGHRVYKNFDPRADIIKQQCDKVLAQLHKSDPLLDIAKKLEEIALHDEYFVSRKLYPNVDFYSGIIMRAIGIPLDMFTVMFAIGRMPGWIANYKEVMEDTDSRICPPAPDLHRPPSAPTRRWTARSRPERALISRAASARPWRAITTRSKRHRRSAGQNSIRPAAANLEPRINAGLLAVHRRQRFRHHLFPWHIEPLAARGCRAGVPRAARRFRIRYEPVPDKPPIPPRRDRATRCAAPRRNSSHRLSWPHKPRNPGSAAGWPANSH